MKNKIQIRWWLHILLVIIFVVIGAYLYHFAFLSGKYTNPNDKANHQFVTFLLVVIICHFIWLLILLIKLILQRRFIPGVFILLLGLADIGLIKVMGFIWATTMMD